MRKLLESWPGVAFLGIATAPVPVAGTILVYVQIIAGLVATAFYIKKFLDKNDEK